MDIELTNKISSEDYNFLRGSVNWKLLSERQIENVLKNSAYFIVARYEGKTIGISRVITDGGNIYFIADVIILPEYQGNGIGRVLMSNVLNYIRDNIMEGEVVQVHLMSVKEKEPFYEKFGFQRRPNESFGNGMTQWLSK